MKQILARFCGTWTDRRFTRSFYTKSYQKIKKQQQKLSTFSIWVCSSCTHRLLGRCNFTNPSSPAYEFHLACNRVNTYCDCLAGISGLVYIWTFWTNYKSWQKNKRGSKQSLIATCHKVQQLKYRYFYFGFFNNSWDTVRLGHFLYSSLIFFLVNCLSGFLRLAL